jgi:hydrogenase maturation protein HypF
MLKTFQISITGQVQGVGFRPFVFTLAKEFELCGTVSNDEKGVIIILTGKEEQIHTFYQKLRKNPPPVSRINQSEIKQLELIEYEDFSILPSSKKGKLNLCLTPDFAICENCKSDVSNPKNRRFEYPFTTCVNCGPRWAITKTFPFERAHTSMQHFEMCEACQEEYSNPNDRRFHSQTNSCATCGIDFYLADNAGMQIAISKNKIFERTAELLQQGKIIAVKNTSGYLLCCDASNLKVIQKLRKKKNRPHKPFAVLYPNLEVVEKHFNINSTQREAFESPQRPIVILPITNAISNLAVNDIAPNLNQVGVLLPYSAILQLIAAKFDAPLIATSGNVHGSPILSEIDDVESELKEVADYFLHHNLKITNPQDDSVLKFSAKFGQEVLFRRSRGYAPNYFGFNVKSNEKILALGGHLKSTIAFLPNDYLYISQYLGNLDNYDVYQRFMQTTHKFIALFEQKPEVVLTDSHPGYLSTQFGEEISNQFQIKKVQIQHHKAHFASVLGEHDLFKEENILGVIWDGTGYGADNQIWGGEFFTYTSKKISRIAHFEYFDWLASDKMAKEPRLSFLSLSDDLMYSKLVEKFDKSTLIIYKKLLEKNQLKTSSVGRLFDAVASVLNICDINSYEGEAAILLENKVLSYDLSICKSYGSVSENLIIPTKNIFKNVCRDSDEGEEKEVIITNFLYTLACIILEIAENKNFKNIACSGGVFQNTTLVDMLKELASKEVKLFFNRNLAPNDENISFGQIMYYLNCKED